MNENYQSRTTIAIARERKLMFTHPSICLTTMRRPMRIIDPFTALMRCAVCGSQHVGDLQRNGSFRFGDWQCFAAGCPTNVNVARRRPAAIRKRKPNRS
jgi:hypothetical protein